MLRVLWATKGLGPGGAERLLVSAAQRHDRDRFELEVVYVLPWKDHLVEELTDLDVPVTCIGDGRRGSPAWVVRLARLLWNGDHDVVHLHSPVLAVAARLLLLGRRRPVTVSTQHNLWPSFRFPTRWANRLTLRRDRHVVAVADTVRESMGRAGADAEVIVHGVPLDEVRARATDPSATRRALGVDDAPLLCTVANLRSNKAYPDLLAAARLVLDERPEVRFVAVGQGPLADELEAERLRLDLGDGFRFLGYRSDAVELTAAADLFVLSSHHEGLPVAVMEALAVGTPVVSTDAGGVTSAVRDDVEGRIVPIARPELLAATILEVLDDDETRQRYARAAAERGRSFSIEAAVHRWEEIYEEVAP
ncbi:MAG: glycosyltransferase [Actinomycetota bacterium]